jgi:TM2 domain-containing membrane protein YozV
MSSQKFILAGIVAGILFFVLGYVLYGMLLANFFNDNLWSPGIMKDKPEPMWALVLGQLAGGFFLAYIVGKAGATSLGAGATVGFVAGLLICLSFDLTFYGVGKFYVAAPLKGIATDVIISAIVSAIGGAGAAWVYGMKRAVAAA